MIGDQPDECPYCPHDPHGEKPCMPVSQMTGQPYLDAPACFCTGSPPSGVDRPIRTFVPVRPRRATAPNVDAQVDDVVDQALQAQGIHDAEAVAGLVIAFHRELRPYFDGPDALTLTIHYLSLLFDGMGENFEDGDIL